MFSLGMAPKGVSLERARLRFVEWLAVELKDDVSDVCLVFDGRGTKQQDDQWHRGVRMRFSTGEKADDLIEQLIRDEKTPASLTVVSNDRRIEQAARRRGCKALSCGEYLDSLDERVRLSRISPEATSDKPDQTTADEIEDWLKKFGG